MAQLEEALDLGKRHGRSLPHFLGAARAEAVLASWEPIAAQQEMEALLGQNATLLEENVALRARLQQLRRLRRGAAGVPNRGGERWRT